jgi:hypothetical protein
MHLIHTLAPCFAISPGDLKGHPTNSEADACSRLVVGMSWYATMHHIQIMREHATCTPHIAQERSGTLDEVVEERL